MNFIIQIKCAILKFQIISLFPSKKEKPENISDTRKYQVFTSLTMLNVVFHIKALILNSKGFYLIQYLFVF